MASRMSQSVAAVVVGVLAVGLLMMTRGIGICSCWRHVPEGLYYAEVDHGVLVDASSL